MKPAEKIRWLIPEQELEAGALTQIWNCAGFDFVLKMAVMPDAHQGYGLPIGGVVLTDNIISPSWVGYDMGCGMTLIVTGIHKDDMFPDKRERIRIRDALISGIPMGVGVKRNDKTALQYKERFPNASGSKDLGKEINANLKYHYGTLGSGNHFIEIGYNQNDMVCITVHSGSRGVGYITARHYMSTYGKRPGTDGAFFDLNEDLGQAYLEDMNFFLEFALENRKLLMSDILDIISIPYQDKGKLMNSMINENHNHAIITEDGVLHRKGATEANKGQYGVIPANMRDGIYVTVGKGNDEFLSSSSHGAGRVMSRSKANKLLDLKEFQNKMEDADVVCVATKGTLDESPDAYKDIDTVIKYQEGVVLDVTDRIMPLINVKSDDKNTRKRRK